jgi:hypothetical protein
MTPNEISTVLASMLDKTFDTPFKLMLMKRVDLWRARLLKNTLDKTPSDRKFFRSTIFLSCTETQEVLCDLPVTTCPVWATARVVKPFRANSMLFDYIGGINGMNPFSEASPGTQYFKTKGKYSKNNVPFLFTDNRVIVYDKVPMIRIDYIPEDPTTVQDYQCTPSANYVCDWWNEEYPCSLEILQIIFQAIRDNDFKQDPKLQEDSIPVNPINDLQQ